MNKSTGGYLYAVHKGRQTGIFLDWFGEKGCKVQVEGFEGAKYRKFKNIDQARQFVTTGKVDDEKKKKKDKGPPEEDRYFRVPSPCKIDASKEPLILYIDGSAKEWRPGIPLGGYGIWFGIDDERNVKEKFPLPNHTNNRCEVMAARRAIEIVRENHYADEDAELILATDSLYVINAMKCKGEWKGKSTKNQSLLRSLYQLTQTRPVTLLYVPGHSGITGNEGADKLAKAGASL